MKRIVGAALFLCAAAGAAWVAQERQDTRIAAEMAEAARTFLDSLPPETRAKAAFDWTHEARTLWHFVPRVRPGLPFKEMTSSQRQLAHALLSSGLSQRGYAKTMTLMSLEEILHDLEKKNPRRDPDLYYVAIFGTPGTQGTWSWRVEGHHLSVNFTLVDGLPASAPIFFGSNPATVLDGPRKGLRLLGPEEDLARQLMKSLDEAQQKEALIAPQAPKEIVSGTDPKAKIDAPAGIPAARLTEAQRALLRDLFREHAERRRTELSAIELDRLRKDWPDKVFFAWAGGLEPGQGHYYRIQTPSALIEYDNIQNNANHVHTVWRDLENDFGADLLRRHYEQNPHPK